MTSELWYIKEHEKGGIYVCICVSHVYVYISHALQKHLWCKIDIAK